MNDSSLYPVQVLREHITALEAALSVCLAEPDHKPVHRLRTETRRVEALLVLLDLTPSLPDTHKEAAHLRRSLRKLRRAAGAVRDLDVHRRMLEKLTLSGSAADRPQAHALEQQGAEASHETLRRAASKLRDDLGQERDTKARELQDLLRKRQTKTARAAEALLQALEPAQNFALPGSDLLRDAELVLQRDGLLKRAGTRKLGSDDLHTVRKSAKRARYLAEMLPVDADLAAAATRYEALQEAGGQWHDALQLTRAARQRLGKGHVLTALFREERGQTLERYRVALAATATSAKEAASGGPRQPPRRRPGGGKDAAGPLAPSADRPVDSVRSTRKGSASVPARGGKAGARQNAAA